MRPMKSIPLLPEERPTREWTVRPLAIASSWRLAGKITVITADPKFMVFSEAHRFERLAEPEGYFVPPGLALEYAEPGAWIDPLLQVDSRGRRLVEALTAIELHNEFGHRMPETSAVIRFVETFGPVFATGHDPDSSEWEGGPDYLFVIGQIIRQLDLCIGHIAMAQRGPDKAFARDILTTAISANLPAVRMSQGSDGRFGLTLAIRSLREAAFWQLFEHVTHRPTRTLLDAPDPVFRAPYCGYCDGVILGTRVADEKANKWHAGCKDAGQAAQRRRQRREAVAK
jgi:hypothetical protein